MPKVLVAGVGNIFLGDDAFGVEVVRHLHTHGFPEGADVVDFGIRGIDLAFTLQTCEYETVILVDACPRGKAPGTLFVLEPTVSRNPGGPIADAHDLDPAKVLAWAERSGTIPPRLRVVGCEPSPASLEEMCAGLSPPVAGAVEPAAGLVRGLIEEALTCTS
jgi:hydrogenase maturation protease